MKGEAMKRALTPVPAIERARQAWRGHAAIIRGELRSMGVKGDTLRRLDDRAQGARGTSVTKQLFDDALLEARAGLPMEIALQKTAQVVELTVQLAYQQAELEQQQMQHGA